jgi:hypothetical protein
MIEATRVGGALALVGVAAYVAGVAVPYPGRAFSLPAVMIGLTVLFVARSERGVEA